MADLMMISGDSPPKNGDVMEFRLGWNYRCRDEHPAIHQLNFAAHSQFHGSPGKVVPES